MIFFIIFAGIRISVILMIHLQVALKIMVREREREE